MRRNGRVYLLLTALLVACDRGESSPPRPLDGARVQLLGSSPPLPPSADENLAAMTADYACAFDTYEVQIVCAARGGADVARFGREGGGPGELRDIGALVSGPGDTVAYDDARNRRISLFSSDGYVGHLPKPFGLRLADDLPEDSTFTGQGFPAIGGPPVLTVVNVRQHRDSVNWKVILEFDPQELGSNEAALGDATRLRSGRFVARVASSGRTTLALYDRSGPLQPNARERHQETMRGRHS